MEIKYQKRIRLKHFDYIGYYRYLITICTNKKEQFFKKRNIFEICINVLREISEKYYFKVLAYCFMPDHLHLLIEGKDEKSDLKKFVSMYKQKSTYYVKKNVVRGFSLANSTHKATLKGRTT